MNQLDAKRRTQVIASLVEGNSIRATVRMTGVAKNTVVKLLADLVAICTECQDKAFRNLPCKRIQCDEIWSFCYAKDRNLPKDKRNRHGDPKFGYGSVWTWAAAFSKKIENLACAVALHFMYYNFCRIHQSLRVTPAMAAGVTDRL